MRILAFGLLASMTFGGAVVAATPNPDLAAPIHTFIDAFNKGDGKTAAATHTTDVAIIDESPPYLWRGPTAFADWSRDLAADDAKVGITGEMVTLGDVVRTEVSGRKAYVIVAAVYSFKDHGAAMHEPARMTFALRKGTDGWKIAAWTWTGPKPKAGEAPAKP